MVAINQKKVFIWIPAGVYPPTAGWYDKRGNFVMRITSVSRC
ncbi:MAG: hypothetical protein Q8O43_07175 [Dehalococcoidia bacterium]|nr:hypothetical protein [Dehalococcoidia bacterium]